MSIFNERAGGTATFRRLTHEFYRGVANDPPLREMYLTAISLGAVFFGAMTYIRNGPNFMVKSVAESTGVEMPSFGGYIKWSCIYLLPILFAVCAVFIARGAIWHIVGWLLIVGLVVRAIIVGRQAKRAFAAPPTSIDE